MMAVVLDGVAPWDGRYEFDDFAFSNREFHEIRKLSGLRPSELIEALDANDTSAFVALAYVVLGRHGKRIDVDDLWAGRVGSITIDIGTIADPTMLASEGEPSTSSGSSGNGSRNAGDPEEKDQKATGSLSSAPDSESVPATSVT